MALKAAVAAFRDPSSFPGDVSLTDRQAYFNLLWSYYKNSAFDNLSAWASYRSNFQLYRNIRPIYNPTRRVVNFYVAQVYPGVLSEDATKLPDGVQLAIPLSEDTDDKLKMAIAQFWQWSNWQANNKLMVRYGGATGSCLVELFDDVQRGKVSTRVQWPGLLAAQSIEGGSSLVLDDVGNVKFYALEWTAIDSEGQDFTYRKEVSPESFRYFRDDVPFVPDGAEASEIENPYGFVPAVWCKHIDEGDDFGCPAVAGSISKIDELNGLASHTHDQVDILIDSPGVIASGGSVGRLEQQAADRKTAAADEFSAVNATKEKPTKRMLLKGPADTKWVPLTGNLEPDKVVPIIDRLLTEIEHDFPELGMYQELRKMSSVTGPGAARMMGDVYSRVLEVSGNYDQQSIKLFQMAVAIGGFRYSEGKNGWANKNDQQAKFAPFNIESYQKGDLNMAIMPRPLIAMTEADTIELTGSRLDNAKKAQGIFSDDKILEVAGIADEAERAAMIAQRKAETPPPPTMPRIGGRNAAGVPPNVRDLLQSQPKQ